MNGTKYPAYGYYASYDSKYVLSKNATVWEVEGFEHIIFQTVDELTTPDVEAAGKLICEYMEPVLVRKGRKYPEKDHMYSYLTLSVVVGKKLSEETVQAVQQYSFMKNYMMTLRGHSEGRLLIVDSEAERIYTNRAGKQMRSFYEDTFREVRDGKIGFSEAVKKRLIVPNTRSRKS